MSSKEWKVGDVAWAARWTPYDEQWIECPVCFGNKVVHLTLGNGDVVELPCDYCGKGYEKPTGRVIQRTPVARGERFHITEVRETRNEQGVEREYLCGNLLFSDDDLFETETGATAEAVIRAEKWQAEQNNRDACIKEKVHKSYSWNAGYHITEAKRLRKQADRHEELAKICKDRSKK
jgi:hypothetical protein